MIKIFYVKKHIGKTYILKKKNILPTMKCESNNYYHMIKEYGNSLFPPHKKYYFLEQYFVFF